MTKDYNNKLVMGISGDNSYSDNYLDLAPPGIEEASIREPNLLNAYAWLKRGEFDRVHQYLGLTSNERYSFRNRQTPLIEPAYLFIAAHLKNVSQVPMNKRNPQMSSFWGMMRAYVSKYSPYKQGRIYSKCKIEQEAIACLFYCTKNANPSSFKQIGLKWDSGNKSVDNVYKQFNDMDFEQKEVLLKHLLKNIKNKGYHTQLLAQWAAMWLSNYYQGKVKKLADYNYKLMVLFSKEIERPLINTVPKLRGPAMYFNNRA